MCVNVCVCKVRIVIVSSEWGTESIDESKHM